MSPLTIGAIALAAGITQPAATQTVALMIKDGLVRAESSATDGRQRLISLTADGKKMVVALTQFWQATAMAASSLEDDMKHPLAEVLASAIEALGHKSFGTRIREARMGMQLDVTSTAAKKRKA